MFKKYQLGFTSHTARTTNTIKRHHLLQRSLNKRKTCEEKGRKKKDDDEKEDGEKENHHENDHHENGPNHVNFRYSQITTNRTCYNNNLYIINL